jgi:hypothetical protein
MSNIEGKIFKTLDNETIMKVYPDGRVRFHDIHCANPDYDGFYVTLPRLFSLVSKIIEQVNEGYTEVSDFASDYSNVSEGIKALIKKEVKTNEN